MKFNLKNLLIAIILMVVTGCVNQSKEEAKDIAKNEQMTAVKGMTAAEILGNPDYLAMSYGGYRNVDHG
ncbi:MAG: glycosyl hydrolase family 17, partial [Lutimonas sp.]